MTLRNMTQQSLLQAACLVAQVDSALVEKMTREGADLFLTLITKRVIRVELSALPAEIGPFPETDQLTQPAPEHTTLTEPQPVKLEAGAETWKSKNKGRKQ